MGSVDLGIVGLDDVGLGHCFFSCRGHRPRTPLVLDDEDPAHKPEPCRGHRPRTPLVL